MGASIKKYIYTVISLFAGLALLPVSAQTYDRSREISAPDFVTELRKDPVALHALETAFDKKVLAAVKSNVVRALLAKKFHNAFETSDPNAVSREPLIALSEIDQLRGLLQMQADQSVASPRGILVTDLPTLLAKPAKLPSASQVVPEIPKLLWGVVPNPAFSAQFHSDSLHIADLLTALSLGNGSELDGFDGNSKITTVSGFLKALVHSGHTVTLSSVRSHADFIAMIYDGKDVRWPGWLDTGFKTSDEQSVIVPMGHSQLMYEITGLQVNAKVSYFLGTGGVGYFPHTAKEPEWAGHGEKYKLSSANNNEALSIYKAADLSSNYIRKVLDEKTPQTPNGANDGYGYLGVCNDSVAAVERFLRPIITSFPLVRSRGLDETLNGQPLNLPNDSAPPFDRSDIFRRIQYMSPVELDADSYVDQNLQQLMHSIANDVPI